MNAPDSEIDYSTDDTPSSMGSDDGWVNFGCGDLDDDICGKDEDKDDDDNNNNDNDNGENDENNENDDDENDENNDNDDDDSDHVHTHTTHTTYIKIKSKNGASSRVKPPTVSVKHRSSRSKVKHHNSTTDHRDFIVCFMMMLVILTLLLPERTFVFCQLVGFLLAEVASILIEGKTLRFVLAVVLFTVASLKKQNP
ncbi:uncharacterized protein J4E87_008134 [Alternaria ethzedia]|uniref:uncharacterized protein n=1 Tax=Alternaria ethzedia TaxID=181014 RepID=UPI0020C484F2|nr:uncharacterized protein J4E87_008134 [Alternaria ethzedia]KAI4618124.1 hypothetical protein J4E87_008134 [Alternaria ethzedia]